MNLLFRILLVGYPPEFRNRYGPEMEQVFWEGLRDAKTSTAKVIHIASSISDLAVSAVVERLKAANKLAILFWLLAFPAGLFIGVVDSHCGDDPQAAALLILIFSCALGALVPRRAWRWGIAVGSSIPVFYLARSLLHPGVYPLHPNDFGMIVALIPGMIGSYSGAFLRWFSTAVRE